MAKRRFSNIWGHSTLLFTELSGFFELRDLAEWDYIVNLSNYDWPLRTNAEIHKVLERKRGFSWIDFWSDTEAIAKRTMRPHLGNNALDAVYHPNELSITAWPFPHWQTYKQMQWMILSVGAVDYLRTDPKVLNCS
jgi:Core-2/I-Branching enzyme